MSQTEVLTEQNIRDLRGLIQSAFDQIEDLRQEVLEERELRQENSQKLTELEKAVADLDERTDLLALLNEKQTINGGKAQAALIQHIYNKAKRREEKGKRAAASLDHDQAKEALHHPDVERTTLYQWMRRAAEKVDGKMLYYDDGKLKVNLQADGELPTEFVTGGEV